ncbi:MAG: oxidoreductase [Calditrichaeota bacterium]|nr:oxidoreductase [Calditrichota bacterium]
MAKKKVGFYWCASCGGCEEAVVDLAEDLLAALEQIEIVFWPVAMDFKREDVEKMADGEIFATFINGAVRLSEQEEIVHLLRRKSQVIVAFGACSHMGGIPGLANGVQREQILDYYYHSGPTVETNGSVEPDPGITKKEHGFDLPEFYRHVRALDQVIDVDYYIPGCAPPPAIVKGALAQLLAEEPPPPGTVLASSHALCHECELNETKPAEGIRIKEFKRPHQVEKIDPNTCLLVQGLVCLGPVTRGGCGALCVKGRMPCTGCFGPLDGVQDFGAAALSFVASIIDSNDPHEIERILDEGIPDPLGTFYLYSLPKSLLFQKLLGRNGKKVAESRPRKEKVEA